MGIMNAYYTGLVAQIVFAAIVVFFFYFYAKKKTLPVPNWAPFAAGALLIAYILYVAISGFGQYHVSSFTRLGWDADDVTITYENGTERVQPLDYDETEAAEVFNLPLVKAQYDEQPFATIKLNPEATFTFHEKDKDMMIGELFTIDETGVTRHEGSDKLIPVSVEGGDRVLTTEFDGTLYVLKLHNQIITPDPVWLSTVLSGVVHEIKETLTVTPGLYIAATTDTYPGGSLELTENGKFTFNRNMATSYNPTGSYTIEGDTLICQTIQKEKYKFTIDGDVLRYIEENDGILTPDGTPFVWMP